MPLTVSQSFYCVLFYGLTNQLIISTLVTTCRITCGHKCLIRWWSDDFQLWLDILWFSVTIYLLVQTNPSTCDVNSADIPIPRLQNTGSRPRTRLSLQHSAFSLMWPEDRTVRGVFFQLWGRGGCSCWVQGGSQCDNWRMFSFSFVIFLHLNSELIL